MSTLSKVSESLFFFLMCCGHNLNQVTKCETCWDLYWYYCQIFLFSTNIYKSKKRIQRFHWIGIYKPWLLIQRSLVRPFLNVYLSLKITELQSKLFFRSKKVKVHWGWGHNHKHPSSNDLGNKCVSVELTVFIGQYF